MTFFIPAEGQKALRGQEHEGCPVAQQEPRDLREIEREECDQTEAVLEPPAPNRAAATIRKFPEVAVAHDFAKENATAASIGRAKQVFTF